MSIHRQWIFGRRVMNAFADVETAQRYARELEDREARALGLSMNEARLSVARRTSASPGFLENLRRGRIKSVPSYLMDNIREAFVAALRTEIKALEREINLATKAGDNVADDEILSAQAQLEAAKKILRGK